MRCFGKRYTNTFDVAQLVAIIDRITMINQMIGLADTKSAFDWYNGAVYY
jgi:hypothetical protein